MDFPALIGGFWTAFSSKAEIQSAKNLYLERIESGAGRGPFAMYRSPGLKVFPIPGFGAANAVCRGMFELNDHLFDIQNGTIYDILSDASINVSYGPIADDGLTCTMDASLNSLFVVSNKILYRVNAGLMTPATPFVPITVGVIDGIVVAIADGTNQFFFSNDDGATWGALDYQTAEAYPNALLNLLVSHQELWLFGNRRTQVFVVGSDPNAPFVPVSAGVIEYGLSASRALAKLDNSIFWLGRDKDGDNTVYRANGYTPVAVSNPAIENKFRTYGDVSDATMSTYQLNGHSCLRLNFPSANGGLGATWEYDTSTSTWAEIAWWNMLTGKYERHRGNSYVSAFGKILVGDRTNGYVYEMSPDFFTDYGYPIRWERRTPHLTKDGLRVQYKRFDLFMQVGVGTDTPVWLNDHSLLPAAFAAALAVLVGAATITAAQSTALTAIYAYLPYDQDLELPASEIMTPLGFYDSGSNPLVSMRFSNNGGNTWSDPRDRSMGAIGEYSKRIYWNRLGMARDRVWEISGTAPVKTAIVQGAFEAEPCYS